MDQVGLRLLLALGLGYVSAYDICSQSPGTVLTDATGDVMEAHMEQRTLSSAPQTCEVSVKRQSQISRIEVTRVMFSLDSGCGDQQYITGSTCSGVAPNYLRINDRELCSCRSADEPWQPIYTDHLRVSFHRASPSAASFAITYRVQGCDVTKLVNQGYNEIQPVMYDRVDAYCSDGSLVDGNGKQTNRTLISCHFENGTWESAQHCASAGVNDDDGKLPPSQEVVQHQPSRFHTDDDGDGHFPKELVGGLAFVLVILVVVVIGATIYTVKRRYKVIVVRRPSRTASANSRRGSSQANIGSKVGRAAGSGVAGPDDEESALAAAAEERLLPPGGAGQSAYGPAPGTSPYRAQRLADDNNEHEYATPFDPAVGEWSQPSPGQPLNGLNSALPPQQPPPPPPAEKPHYFVVDPDPSATS